MDDRDEETPPSMKPALGPSEALISDIIGRLIEFWGFKRNMGRIWAVLYLSPQPLSAQELRDRLALSSGAVSMSLNDLLRWSAIRRVWIQGERRDHYTAELQLWKMFARVLSERERAEIVAATEACEDALRILEAQATSSDRAERERALFQKDRIRALFELAKLGKTLLDGLLTTTKLDIGALRRFRLGAR